MYLQNRSICIKKQHAITFYISKSPLSLTLFPEFSVSLRLQLSQGGKIINGKYAFLPGREKNNTDFQDWGTNVVRLYVSIDLVGSKMQSDLQRCRRQGFCQVD